MYNSHSLSSRPAYTYNLRSSAAAAPTTTNVAQSATSQQGYQPPTVHGGMFSGIGSALDSVTATLDTLPQIIDSLKVNTDVEIGLCNVVRVLIGQLKEMILDIHRLKENVDGSFRQMDGSMVELTRQVVKGEQYNRRDTVTVVGLPLEDGESQSTLTEKVAQHLSNSGEEVKSSDLTVVHRNGKTSREVRGKKVPPSVTAKFSKISKKDSVLRQYRNYDQTKKTARPVKVYQSLTNHYSELRRFIAKFFDTDNSTDNLGKKLK